MNQSIGQVTKDLQTHVTAIVHTVQGIGSLTGQIEHGLRINVNQFQLGRRHRVLHRIGVFELSQTDSHLIVLRESVVGVEFLNHA